MTVRGFRFDENESEKLCKYLIEQEWACRPGCPKLKLEKSDKCPFDDGDAQECDCPNYRQK